MAASLSPRESDLLPGRSDVPGGCPPEGGRPASAPVTRDIFRQAFTPGEPASLEDGSANAIQTVFWKGT
jgi:hypothetical protein